MRKSRSLVAGSVAILLAVACGPAPRPTGQAVLGGGDPALARTVAVATIAGPEAPATDARATAICPRGSTPVGGGIATALSGGGKPPSSLHANGSLPQGRGWLGVGDTGGQPVLGAATTAVAVCLEGAAGTPIVVRATVAGPGAARTTARATASCPGGTLLVGGGGLTGATGGGPGSPSLHLLGTYPSRPDGSPAAQDQPASAWTAAAGAGGRQGAGLQTTAFALCLPWAGHRTTVAVRSVPGPFPPGGSQAAAARCAAGSSLLSGGALTGPTGGGPPQQGLHLTGSFPGTAEPGAARPTPQPAVVPAWTARAEAGGQGAPAGTETTAFALCLAAHQ